MLSRICSGTPGSYPLGVGGIRCPDWNNPNCPRQFPGIPLGVRDGINRSLVENR